MKKITKAQTHLLRVAFCKMEYGVDIYKLSGSNDYYADGQPLDINHVDIMLIQCIAELDKSISISKEDSEAWWKKVTDLHVLPSIIATKYTNVFNDAIAIRGLRAEITRIANTVGILEIDSYIKKECSFEKKRSRMKDLDERELRDVYKKLRVMQRKQDNHVANTLTQLLLKELKISIEK